MPQDYCCINQDHAPASELANLGNLIQACDMMLTPVVDPEHDTWTFEPRLSGDVFLEYGSTAWRQYWERAWCRVEAMLAAVKPVDHGRAALFRGAIARALEENRRPHTCAPAQRPSGRQPAAAPELVYPRLLATAPASPRMYNAICAFPLHPHTRARGYG